MDEMKENLKKMGWDEELIGHFMKKPLKAVEEVTLSELKPLYCEVSNFVLNGNYESSASRVFISK